MAEVSPVKLLSNEFHGADRTDDKPTLVQVMAWCRQATSHYMDQCWPKSMSPKGVRDLGHHELIATQCVMQSIAEKNLQPIWANIIAWIAKSANYHPVW